ncbi:MAG: hypothetical protein ACLPUO_02760 [Streptosporangiaceae bacterium]|jgi:hypothetical protein
MAINQARLDLAERISAYEQGELEDTAIFQLFQHMIDTGMAWRLRGSYGRMAAYLIENGHCHDPIPGESVDDDEWSEDAYSMTY